MIPSRTKEVFNQWKNKHIQLLGKMKYGKKDLSSSPRYRCNRNILWGCWRTHTHTHTHTHIETHTTLGPQGRKEKFHFEFWSSAEALGSPRPALPVPGDFASAAKGLVLKAWFSLSRAIPNHLSHTDRRWKYIPTKLLDWGWVYQTNYAKMLWEVGGDVITYDRDDQNCLHSKSGNW